MVLKYGLVFSASELRTALQHRIELITGIAQEREMVAPSASTLDLCLLPRTEPAIELDGVVAAFATWGGVCVWK